MKTKILGGVIVLAIATITAINVNLNTGKDNMSLLALSNVEALASESSNYSCTIKHDCGNGGSVSCTGDVCKRSQSGRKWVECDFKKTWC